MATRRTTITLCLSHVSIRHRLKTTTQSIPIILRRNAARRTSVKVSDLPQGVLPPLPKIEQENESAKEYPVVLQQHRNNMLKYKDCVLLTRVGDFYEMYFEHVEQYAPQVGLKMAKRNTTLGDVPMAGFQHSQLERYVKMFMDLDKHVAIAEQIRIPDHERLKKSGAAKFDRKVTRVITPGTLVDESFVDAKDTNFLLAIDLDMMLQTKSRTKEGFQRVNNADIGLAWVDLSSGDFNVQHTTMQSLSTVVARVSPREIVLKRSMEAYDTKDLATLLGDGQCAISFHDTSEQYADIGSWLPMLESPSSEEYHDLELSAGSIILDYVSKQLIDANVKLQPPVRRNDSEYMLIDKQTLRALEIKSTLRDNVKQGSLLHSIRRTTTNSGARLLSQRIVSPVMSISAINQRLNLAEEMLLNPGLLETIVQLLKATSDSSRLLQKFSMGRGDADDLLSMARTIEVAQAISDVLQQHALEQMDRESQEASYQSLERSAFIWTLLHRLDLEIPNKVAKQILTSIDQEGLSKQQSMQLERAELAEGMANEVVAADETGQVPPKLTRRMARTNTTSAVTDRTDVWIMNRNSSTVLREAHRLYRSLSEDVTDLETALKAQFNTASLTLRFAPHHGYFCHIKGKDMAKAPGRGEGIRQISSSKSTSTFAVSEWTVLGTKLDGARLRIREEEDKVLAKLRALVLENLMKLRRNAGVLDELDVACSSAYIAKERHFVRPVITETKVHKIVAGRHPTVDVGLTAQGKHFISNDCFIGETDSLHFITGPNMGGKSTFLRQNALITILAQTGSFVPAEYAEIGLVDKMFSRVGSADSLYNDQSTFMVEMLETAEILKEATERSFVIMDEIGRGTTPQDGIAVGYACLHHLRYTNKCRTLFATHFHDLANMTAEFGGIAFHCTDVDEAPDGSWAYVHRLRRGVNRESHALKVARLAGLPEAAIAVAGQVLHDYTDTMSPAKASMAA